MLLEVPKPLARALGAATARREALRRGAPALLRVSRLRRELVLHAALATPVFLGCVALPLRGRCDALDLQGS